MNPCCDLLRRASIVWLLLMALTPAPSPAAEVVRLDAWAFHLGDVGGAEQPDFDDATWQTIAAPHDWSIAGERRPDAPSEGGGGFFPTGVGWYRHAFVAPRPWGGQHITAEFEGVYGLTEVWLNGTRLGTHAYGYTPFSFDLTPHLRAGTENVLAVRVDNSAQPNSRFYSGSGLIRPAWLRVVDPVHVAPDSVIVATAEIFPQLATLDISAGVRNTSGDAHDVTVDITLIDPAGLPVAHARTELRVPPGSDDESRIERKLTVPHPQVWSPDSPALYRAMVRVLVGARLADRVEINFGIRTAEFSAARGFELNGEPIELFGGNVHHDTGPLGAAAWPRAEERKVAQLKAAGFNAVRTAHNPPSTAFLDACDRLGLLVIDEAFDGWARAKLKNDYSRHFGAHWQRDLAAMVRRDRHHACVILWSLGNEVYERGHAEGLRLAREMAAHVRALDPTRGVTIGLNGLGTSGDWTQLDPIFAAVDVAGYNYELGRHADDHRRVPARVLYAAESYQRDAFMTWQTVHEQPNVIGDFVWSALDYLGEAGIGRVFPPDESARPHWEGNHFPWHGAACGDIDLTGWRKPISHYRAIVWDREERLYAAVRVPTPDGRPWNLSAWSVEPALPSWTWPGREGKPLTVDVYSRHEFVQVFLNEQLLGEQPTTAAQEFKASFEIPYAPGTLRVVGLDHGRVAAEFELATTGPAARIALTPDRREVQADGPDLVFIEVEVVDANGRRRFDANHAIHYTLEGPGTIAAIGSGDLATTESYQANPRRVFQGRAIVVVRTTRQAGEVTLTAEVEELEHAKTTFRSR